MRNLKLILPNEQHENELMEVLNEFRNNGEKIVPFGLYYGKDTFFEILQTSRDYERGINIPSHLVPSTTYWLIDEDSDRIIGAVNIRHYLNNYLREIGGHIGYGIRPSERRKGYATKILETALEKCSELGIDSALVTCDSDNTASEKTILANGGIFDSEGFDADNGKAFKRYNIDTGLIKKNLYLNSAYLYDLDQRDVVKDDIPFYLDYAKANKGKVLELGCGTGRVAMELAQNGISVTGLDLSNEMLNIFKNKIASDEIYLNNINIIKCNMANFSLDTKFSLIIAPFRAFQALTTENDINGCLRCVRNHLAIGGKFIVNVFRPYKILDESWIFPETVQWERIDEATGMHVVKKHGGDKIDIVNQIIYPHFTYEITSKDGVIKKAHEKLMLKYYYYEQLRDKLLSHGFKITEEFGWYDKRDMENGREMIFVCEL